MLNLLHSGVCGNSVNPLDRNSSFISHGDLPNNNNVNNYYLKERGNGHFDRNIKFQEPISIIKISESASNQNKQLKELSNKKNSGFFRDYCLCMYKRVDPDDENDSSDEKYEPNDNEFSINRTSAIPITIDPRMYVNV